MTKHPYQTYLRMPLTLKEDMTSMCGRLSMNSSDLMRKVIADFVKNLNKTPDVKHRYLFSYNPCVSRIAVDYLTIPSLFVGNQRSLFSYK